MPWCVVFFGTIALSVAALWASALPLPVGGSAPEPPCRWPCDFATPTADAAAWGEPEPLGGWLQVDAELARLGPAINSGAIPIENGECVTAMDGESLELWLACGPDGDAMLDVAPLDGARRTDDRPRSETTLPPDVLDALKGWVDGIIAGDVSGEQTAVFLYDVDSGKVATWVGTDVDAFLASSRTQLASE